MVDRQEYAIQLRARVDGLPQMQDLLLSVCGRLEVPRPTFSPASHLRMPCFAPLAGIGDIAAARIGQKSAPSLSCA